MRHATQPGRIPSFVVSSPSASSLMVYTSMPPFSFAHSKRSEAQSSSARPYIRHSVLLASVQSARPVPQRSAEGLMPPVTYLIYTAARGTRPHLPRSHDLWHPVMVAAAGGCSARERVALWNRSLWRTDETSSTWSLTQRRTLSA